MLAKNRVIVHLSRLLFLSVRNCYFLEKQLSTGVYAQVQSDPKANPAIVKGDVLYESFGKNCVYDVIGSPEFGKSGVHSVMTREGKEIIYNKPRALSEGILEVPRKEFQKNSPSRSMSIDEEPPENDIVSIYNQIDKALDGAYITEDDDDEDAEEEQVLVSIPKPRDGFETYAFDEIRKFAEISGIDMDIEVDLAELAESYNLMFDSSAEYPGISLLTSFLNKL